MSHVVEVDQSGKIEDTATATVLAFADGVDYAIVISSKVKRDCLAVMRVGNQLGKTMYLQLFSAALYLLLKNHLLALGRIIIDQEYVMRERDIKRFLVNLIRKDFPTFDTQIIQFDRIGKSSTAPDRAIATLRGKIKPDRKITAEELLGLVRGFQTEATKKDRGLLKSR